MLLEKSEKDKQVCKSSYCVLKHETLFLIAQHLIKALKRLNDCFVSGFYLNYIDVQK